MNMIIRSFCGSKECFTLWIKKRKKIRKSLIKKKLRKSKNVKNGVLRFVIPRFEIKGSLSFKIKGFCSAF